MNNIVRILFLPICIALFSYTSNIKVKENKSTDTIAKGDSIVEYPLYSDNTALSEVDFAIINGDKEEYRQFHNKFSTMSLKDSVTNEMIRTRLFYSEIMAEQYNDTLAAQDFVSLIEEYGIHVDSSMAKRIIRYLEMGALSKDKVMSFFSALKLHNIYKDGKYGIPRDIEKATYYDQLCDTIAKREH